MAQPTRHLSRFLTKACYRLLLLIMTGFSFTPASALENDAQQPISVLAQNAEFNPDQGIAIYTGKVEIEQGSLRIKAHKITVYRKPDGEIDKIFAEGLKERVHLQQQPKPESPIVQAYAMKIDYQASEQQVELTQQAELENGLDRFSGERIRYHLQSKRIQAWGQNKVQDGQSTDGRVKIILLPTKDEQAQ